MTTPKSSNDAQNAISNDSEPTGKPNSGLREIEEEKWDRAVLLEGLATVIARGRRLACMHPIDDKNEEAATAEAWYEAISGVIPCQHWKEVGLWTSRYTNPADKFTLRQFFEAWAKFCEQGRARGHETWR